MKFFPLIFLFVCLSALAEDLYFTEDGAGAHDGSSIGNAWSVEEASTAGNWGAGAGKVSSGDTLHVSGTITNFFTVGIVPGFNATPAIILFDSGAKFSRPCFPVSGAIQLNVVSNITVDGGVNGKIENTANGWGLTFSNNSRGIGGNQSGSGRGEFVTIKNLTVTNIFRKVIGDDQLGFQRAGYGIDIRGSSITYSNCVVSDGDGLIGYSSDGPGQSNIFILGNKLLDGNHQMTIGVGDVNCQVDNIIIASNYFDHTDTWDTAGGTQIHLDGVIILNNGFRQDSVIRNLQFYRNYLGPHGGVRGTTAAFFNSMQNPQWQSINWYIGNNLFEAARSNSWGNGFVAVSGSNVIVFNNTCWGTNDGVNWWGGGMTCRGTNNLVYNNILRAGSGITIGAGYSNAISISIAATNFDAYISNILVATFADYNLYPGPATGFQNDVWSWSGMTWLSGIFGTLADWQTRYGNNQGYATPTWYSLHADPHSSTSYPTFNSGTYVPATNDTVASLKGTNLTALVPAELRVDFNGVTRPASGPWTIGAFESGTNVPSGGGGGAAPDPYTVGTFKLLGIRLAK